MLNLQFINKLFNLTPEAKLKKFKPLVEKIESIGDSLKSKDNQYFATRIIELKTELSANITQNKLDTPSIQKELDKLLPEVFALVREASTRILNMRHYPVQLLGGIVLHQSKIAEMKTGEGKTLVATCPAVLNALTGKGVHVITVNDYLAERDSEWMGKLYKFLGLSVGLIKSGQNFSEKQEAYNADILYSTNNELGFDYLRDNMATSLDMQVRRDPFYAIIDEVDSVLIDEARTPLIISGNPEANKQEIYLVMNQLAMRLKKGLDKDDTEADYYLEEKNKSVVLTDTGIQNAEQVLGIDDLWDVKANLAHHLLQGIKAHEFFKKDQDYIVQINHEANTKEIVIVDEFTGRLMNGRRWSDGLHQAVEAKEAVNIQEESLTLASITFQNFFRLYPKLSGMTGTALTEEEEFQNIYNLPVLPIPANKKNQRQDLNDKVYKNQEQKYFAILEEIINIHKLGQPILVGTTNIDMSEMLSDMLSKPRASVNLLNIRSQRLIDLLQEAYADETVFLRELKKVLDRPLNIKYQKIQDLYTEYSTKVLDSKLQKSLLEASQTHELTGKEGNILCYLRTLAASALVIETIRSNIEHNVLNAKQHDKEASIIAQAGRKGAITIATNMAGRGTDIVLGGNIDFLVREKITSFKLDPNSLDYQAKYQELYTELKPAIEQEQKEVLEQGGLHIIGAERHESRRIDNQLRGRAGRQGDIGSTKFFLALDDQLMRIFGGDKISNAFNLIKTDDDIAIEAGLITRGIENAQKKVEGHNFEIRKRLLEYDDVSNIQREWVYKQRQQVLEGYDLRNTFTKMIREQIDHIVHLYLDPEKSPEVWYERVAPQINTEELTEEQIDEINNIDESKLPRQIDLLLMALSGEFTVLSDNPALTPEAFSEFSFDELVAHIQDELINEFNKQETELTTPVFEEALRYIFLKSIDEHWVEHLQALDALRDGIHLRGYGNKQPLIEYKREAFEMFEGQLFANIRKQAAQWIYHVEKQEVPSEKLTPVN